MTEPFFNDWMNHNQPEPAAKELVVLTEKGKVEAVEAAVRQAAMDHLVGLEILERIGGYPEAAAFVRNKIPTDRRVRSGDLGEILASEYINQCTDFEVPIKRLRWKDDRNTTMRGNDVLGICLSSKSCRLLKAESKSRAKLHAGVVEEAISGLQKHSGRPNPSSLAFISARLRENGEEKKAEVFEKIQSGTLKPDGIEHLVFTFSGNDPTEHLKKHVAGVKAPKRHLIGCRVDKHQEFIQRTFESLNAPKRGPSR